MHMPSPLHELFAALWKGYASINPQANRIQDLLRSRGEFVENDHIAFRTLNWPGLTIDDMAAPFVACGYREQGRYVFVDKHLTAKHWQHPDASWPKVFISQLGWKHLTPGGQSLMMRLANTVPPQALNPRPLCITGRPWNLTLGEYQALARESEYAAWLAAFGFQANHFTVAAHGLQSFSSLLDLNVFIKSQGFALNNAGGEIKGSPGEGLEQSSTWASSVPVKFSDGMLSVPGCYYEFAWRFKRSDGSLFHGFLEKSADKIFESTHSRQAKA